MKKIEVKKDIFEYKFDNEYVKKKIKDKDRKCTKLFTSFYKFLNKTKLLKICSKNKKIKFLHECTFSNYDFEHKTYKKDLKTKLKLKKLFIYDILPKENLSYFENNFKKFRKVCDNNMFMTAGFNLQKSFDNLKNATSGSLHDYLKLSKKLNSFKYFDFVSINIDSISDSFLSIRYELTPNEVVQKLIENILEEDVYESPVIYTNNKWWKIKDIGGSSCCDDRAKKNTLQNFFLELKHSFMCDVKKFLGSFMFDNKLTPHGLEVLSIDNFEDSNEIVDFLQIKQNCYLHKKEKIIFSLVNNSFFHPNYIMDSIVIVDDKDKEKNGEHKWFPEVFYNLAQKFTIYYILTSINNDITLKINKSNTKINDSIKKGKKILSLMKLNREIDKDLFFYKRLMNEIQISEKSLERHINSFLENYEPLEKQPKGIKHELIYYDYTSTFYELDANRKLLKDVYSFFNENINSIANYSTMKNISWTLFIAILALLVSIVGVYLTADPNCEALNKFIELIKNLF
ncbi:hypothetical protein IJD15_02330 [bacterium]|nr:hypothetical protein [bacterium]